jgi:hypothetical protein
MDAAWPGDLVTVRAGNIRLYKRPGPADENAGNPITGIASTKELGLVIAVTETEGLNGDPPYKEVLVLFGEKLGWRDCQALHWVNDP